MNVGFRLNGLGFGGVEVAVYDYAFYNKHLLGNESIIFYREENTEPSVKDKFGKEFKLIPYKSKSDIENNLKDIEVLYSIKSGEPDEYIFPGVINSVHAVFTIRYPQGNRFASISRWLSKTDGIGITPWVPHMINLPDHDMNMRENLGIPKDAFVFGRHGSFKEFNVPFVWDSINEVLQKRSNAYFLFLNTPVGIKHERVINLDPIWDLDKKTEFINSCDAMIHARSRGETFGIACGEFSIRNKPVITYGLSPEKAHIDILGDKCLIYNSKTDLSKILLSLEKNNKDWDAYSEEYTKVPVMNKFKKIFL
jgi:hypothetical protein